MALVATVGSTTSNSYVTLNEADAYFMNHWSIAKQDLWNGLTIQQKEAVLKAACQVVDTLRVLDDANTYASTLPIQLQTLAEQEEDFFVIRLENYQRLSFPRSIDVDSSGAGFLPQQVKDAQCEQAVYMLSVDESPLAAQNSGILSEEVVVGGVEIRTRYAGAGKGERGMLIAPMTLDLMRPFLRSAQRRVRRA